MAKAPSLEDLDLRGESPRDPALDADDGPKLARSAEVELAQESDDPEGDEPEEDAPLDAEDATFEDWREADAVRPDLPDETDDGLDPTEEEVRRQAEDR